MWLIERIIQFFVWPLNWIEGLMWRARQRPVPNLIVDEKGFSLSTSGQMVERYGWAEVGRIVAFKVDCYSYDEICLQIDIGRRVGPLVISEQFDGYKTFVTTMEVHLPGVKKDWWSEVAFPAFAENATTVFDRG